MPSAPQIQLQTRRTCPCQVGVDIIGLDKTRSAKPTSHEVVQVSSVMKMRRHRTGIDCTTGQNRVDGLRGLVSCLKLCRLLFLSCRLVFGGQVFTDPGKKVNNESGQDVCLTHFSTLGDLQLHRVTTAR